MKIRLLLAILLLICVQTAQAQAGFIFGYAIGSSGKSAMSSSDSSIMYIAPEDVMKTVTDMMLVRMVSATVCPNTDSTGGVKKEASISFGEIFAKVTTKLPKKQRTILQITRVFYSSNNECATFWFNYIEK
jgi:hypothetical protein